MTITLQNGYDIDTITIEIENMINNYLLDIRKSWGIPTPIDMTEYIIKIYRSQIIVRLLQISGILNVTDISLNGNYSDITLIEDENTQQVPFKGQVIINVT